jgi:hypothetical protein
MDATPHLLMSHEFLLGLGAPLPSYTTARRNLFDVKGVFQRNAFTPAGSLVSKIEPLMFRFPLIAWDIWQKNVYLLTNDVKPPSHFPIFGWRRQRVLDYVRRGQLLVNDEVERAALGTPGRCMACCGLNNSRHFRKLQRRDRSERTIDPLSIVGGCCAGHLPTSDVLIEHLYPSE